MPFTADFEIKGNGSYANEKIFFQDISDIGAIIDSNDLTVSGNISKSSLNLSDFTVTSISKYKWTVQDGNYFYTSGFSHKIKEAGVYTVQLEIWSEKFTELGEDFYFVHSITKEVTVQSRFYKFLIDNYPIYDSLEKKDAVNDLFLGIGQFFDKIHSSISEIYTLNDIDNVSDKYLEYIALTLGHDESYIKKISASISGTSFSEYNILDKIKLGTVTDQEIYNFRRFLIYSSEFFKSKGTPQSLEKFLYYFSINAKVIDLWTTNWGLTTKGTTSALFIEDTFANNKLGMVWENIRILGHSNDYGHIIKTPNSIILNSYNKVQKIENTENIFTEADILSKSLSGYDSFESLKYIKAINYDDTQSDLINGGLYYTPVEQWYTPLEVREIQQSLYAPREVLSQSELTLLDTTENRIIYDDISPTTTYYVTTSSGTSCYSSLVEDTRIVKELPTFLIKDIRYHDGGLIEYLPENYEINTYLTDWTTVANVTGTFTYSASAVSISSAYQYYPYVFAKNFIDIKSNFLEDGDRLSVLYNVANDETKRTAIVSSDTCKNLDISFKFSVKNDTTFLTHNQSVPQNEVYVILRGIQTEEDNYSTIQDYYSINLNTKKSIISVSKVSETNANQTVYQKLNLSGDVDNNITEAEVLNVSGDQYLFNIDTFYEMKASLNGSLLDVYIRELPYFTDAVNNISTGTGSNYINTEDTSEYIKIVSGLDLDAVAENVTTYDDKDNIVSGVTYTYTSDAGKYGVGILHGITVIKQIEVNVLDLDETLYDTVEKELQVKPKFLEWVGNKQLNANSYTNNVPDFKQLITTNFIPNTEYTVDSKKLDSLQSLVIDNIEVKPDIGSRYTVEFNASWLEQNHGILQDDGSYLLNPTFFSKVFVPLGNFTDTFLTENEVYNKQIYKNYIGTDVSGTPGLFFASKFTPLSVYTTEPFDELSSVTRSDDGYGDTIYLNDKIKQYKLSNRVLSVDSIYSEIIPNSTYFPSIHGEWILNSNTKFNNAYFLPVVVNTNTKAAARVIGVKFKQCKHIKDTIKKYSTPINDQVHIYGTFTFHVPNESIKFAPNNEFINSSLYPDYKQFTKTLPLGVLKESIRLYTLSKNFIKENINGDFYVTLDGVFVEVSNDFFTYNYASDSITLKVKNKYENVYDEQSCKHFIKTKLNITDQLVEPTDDVNLSVTTSTSSHNFFIGNDTRALLQALEDTSVYTIDSYNWWLPKSVWIKRDFQIQTLNINTDLISNLNYFGADDLSCVSKQEQRKRANSKLFYGNNIGGYVDIHSGYSCSGEIGTVSASPRLTALNISLVDGNRESPISPNTVYWAKVKININYAGMSQAGLELVEDNLVEVLGSKKKNKFILQPVKKCIDTCIPIAWYADGYTNTTGIEFGNYIIGSYGDNNTPAISLIPYGVVTELLDKFEVADRKYMEGLLNSSNWSFSDWNDYFSKNIDIEFIAEQLPSTVCNLYKNYGLINELNINSGSFVEIKYNNSGLDTKAINTQQYVFDGTSKRFFEVPFSISLMEDWITNVERISLSNYAVNLNKALFTTTSVNITSDSSTLFAIGGDLSAIVKYTAKFNTLNDINDKVFENNFNNIQDINLIAYESDQTGLYTLVEAGSDNILLTGKQDLYYTTNIDSKTCLYSNTDITQLDSIYGKSGSLSRNIKIDLNASTIPTVQKLFTLDHMGSICELSVEVQFDGVLDSTNNYLGKKFEFIFNGDVTYNANLDKNCLSEYYFVGIGTYGFEVALGKFKYDPVTDTIQKSFLAGYGKYKSHNIKSDTWYNFKINVSDTTISVDYGSKDNVKRVLNYIKKPSNPDFYITGGGEEASYIVSGLKNLNIIYPENIGKVAGKEFFENNVDFDFIKGYIPSGDICGFVTYNKYTYVTNLKHTSPSNTVRTFSDTFNVSDYSYIVEEIATVYGAFDSIKYIGKTLNNTIVLHLDDVIYYKASLNPHVVKFTDGVSNVIVSGDKVIIAKTTNNNIDLIVVPQTFDREVSVLVKDLNFNEDHITKYLAYVAKNINQLFIDNGKLIVKVQ